MLFISSRISRRILLGPSLNSYKFCNQCALRALNINVNYKLNNVHILEDVEDFCTGQAVPLKELDFQSMEAMIRYIPNLKILTERPT